MKAKIKASYGRIFNNKFIRKVKRATHYFWSRDGYCFGSYILDLKGVETIRIEELDTKEIYEIDYGGFKENCELIKFPYTQYFISHTYLKSVG